MNKKIFFLILLLLLWHNYLYDLNSKPLKTTNSQEDLKHEVTVTLKLIQVYVMDMEGNPIIDLNKSGFILYDNGKPMEITEFEGHFSLKPKEKFEEERKPSPIQKKPSKMNRKIFFLLDFSRNDVSGLSKSKKAALHFLDNKLLPGDEVGVLSYSSLKGLTLHEYLTTDHQKAREVIKGISEMPGISGGKAPIKIEKNTAKGAKTQGEFEFDESKENPVRVLVVEPKYTLAARLKQSGPKFDAHNFTYVIKELAKALRYIKGYKNIILFSEGFPRSLLYSIDDSSFRLNYEGMIKELAASNSPVYTVNTKGPRPNDSLMMLSELTGGKYFHSVEYYEKISDVIQNITSNYYVIGYYIDEQKWDGRYHEIKVKVKRKGCKVYAQGGYFNPKPFTEYAEVEKQLHLLDLAFGENPQFQEPLKFPLTSLHFSGKKGPNTVLLSEIDLEKIEEVVRGKAETIIFIFDNLNNLIDFIPGEVNFSNLPQKKIYLYTISSLLPGRYECRVVIRNLYTGRGAVASSSAIISESPVSGIRLYTPLLLVPKKKGHYIKVSKKEARRESTSLINIYPFDSIRYSPLIEELDPEISKLWAVVKCSITDIKEPEVEFSAYLIQSSTEQNIPLSISILTAESAKEETDILLIEFPIPELPSGEYCLNLIAEDITTKSRSHVTRTFRVR